jgi:hypothetical protein
LPKPPDQEDIIFDSDNKAENVEVAPENGTLEPTEMSNKINY